MDEIGDLPLAVQVKLLRVLQEGEFERVGGNETLTVDVRVIAATSRNLGEAIVQNRFRKDLFYRLNVFPLELPPLRERKDDILTLAMHFCQKYGKKQNKNIKTISKDMKNALLEYHWPGNVRELENIIERCVVLTQGSELNGGDFIMEQEERSPSKIDNHTLSLKEVERLHILKTIEDCNWVIEGNRGAANRLKVHPSTLRDRMRNLGIKRC